MRIGVDVDGVLADFNDSFIRRIIQVTGRDLFPPRPFDILTWNYPESFGYMSEEVSAVWADIKADDMFWRRLPEYPETADALAYLLSVLNADDENDIYFITSRPGVAAKDQTERWLMAQGFCFPTVLISSEKGMCARALKLDAYIDDRWENALDVAGIQMPDDPVWRAEFRPSKTKTFLMDRPWNQNKPTDRYGIVRTNTVVGFADLVPA